MRRSIIFISVILLVFAALVLPEPRVFAQTEPASKKASPEAAAPTKPALEKQAPTQGYPVILDGSTLFYIRQGYRAYSAEERAEAAQTRIRKFADDLTLPLDSITVNDEGSATEIVAGDRIIVSLSNADAKAEGIKVARHELARQIAEKISTGVLKYRQDYSHRSILHGIILLIVVTVVVIGILIGFHLLYRKLRTVIATRIDARIRSIHIQSFEIIQAERIRTVLGAVVRLMRFAVVFIILYSYVHYALTLFPWTRPIAHALLGYLLVPLRALGKAFLAEIPNLFFLAVLVLITYYALKLMHHFFAEIERGSLTISGFYPEWGMPTYKICRILFIALAAVVAFPYIPGSNSPAFKGVSIFLGVLFSIGSSSAISNFVAGLVMTYRRAFLVGDRVRIGDFIGDVVAIRLQVTILRTPKNEEIIIPNSLILSSHVVNYSMEAKTEGLILHTSVTIGYDAPWRKVHELLISAAGSTGDILKAPSPYVLQTGLNDFYVTYELNAYTNVPGRMTFIYSDLHQNIQDKFNEAGMEIMSPHYTQLRDGHHVTIPEHYLPKGYVAPGLRITRVGNDPAKPEKEKAGSE